MARSRGKAGFWRREDASIEVEYVLILAFVIVPLCLVLPAIIISTNANYFGRLDFWVNLPFP